VNEVAPWLLGRVVHVVVAVSRRFHVGNTLVVRPLDLDLELAAIRRRSEHLELGREGHCGVFQPLAHTLHIPSATRGLDVDHPRRARDGDLIQGDGDHVCAWCLRGVVNIERSIRVFFDLGSIRPLRPIHACLPHQPGLDLQRTGLGLRRGDLECPRLARNAAVEKRPIGGGLGGKRVIDRHGEGRLWNLLPVESDVNEVAPWLLGRVVHVVVAVSRRFHVGNTLVVRPLDLDLELAAIRRRSEHLELGRGGDTGLLQPRALRTTL